MTAEDQADTARALRGALLRFLDPLRVVTYVADVSQPRLRFVSSEIERLLGYPREEWLADYALRRDRLHPQDRYRVMEERARARTEGTDFASEYRMLSKSGRTVWVRDEAVLMRDDAGIASDGGKDDTYWWGVLLDLTERHVAEEGARARAAQQLALATLSQRALAMHDRTRLFTETAELVLDTFAMDRAWVVERVRDGQPLTVTVSAPVYPPATAVEIGAGSIAHKALDASGPVTITDRRHDVEGALPLDPEAIASAAVAIDHPGQSAAVLVVESHRPRVFTRDDTTLLQSLANVLASALSRLSTEAQLGQALKLSALGRLSAGVAHDFNNILAGVLGFGALLEPAVRDDPRAADHLARLRGAAEGAVALVEQLLAFARGRTAQPVAVDLNGLVADMIPMLTQLLGAGHSLLHQPTGAAVTVHADPHQVEQVVMNLVVNARDAMPEGGQIELRTRTVDAVELADEPVDLPPNTYAVLEVEDQGTGMDAATREKIFEPFFTTKAPTEGTGLGLSTVSDIVERHGGTVAVESEVDLGTRFAVYLPEAPAAAVASRGSSAQEPAPRPPAAAQLSTAPVIVVVDDQHAIRTIVQETLSDQGYEVVAAEDGARCMALLEERTTPVDLLVTDVTMPGLTGPQLAQRVWKIHPDLPVIYMSGYADAALRNGDAHLGPVHVLPKPFSLQELLAVVNAALASRG